MIRQTDSVGRPTASRALRTALAVTLTFLAASGAEAARCLFVSSYHQGYAWSDGVERGLRSVLEGRCEVRQFDMDTKRNKDAAYKERIALEVKALVESWQPDVVITADDNAAKYVVVPHFKDSATPFVFCGVNWTADEYGFPFANVTGIVEVAPIRPMLERAAEIAGAGSRAFYIGADTLTEKKNLKRFQDAAADLGVELTHALVPDVDAWLEAYAGAQDRDFIIVGSNSGIEDWDQARVEAVLGGLSRRLTVTNHGWMMPYSMFGMTKVPEEHGEWSGQTALAILDGMRPADIPIVANRKWDLWANEGLLAAADISLPRSLRHKAKRIR